MGYSVLATNVRNKLTGLDDSITALNNVSFDGVWKGSAKDSLTSSLEDLITKLNIERSKVDAYAGLLDNLQAYKDNKLMIAALQSQLYSIPATEENAYKRSYLSSLIQENTAANEQLKVSLQNAFSSFGSVGVELNLVTYTVPTNAEYLVDVQELKAMYDNRWGDADGISGNPLTKLANGESIYDYYNQVDENGNVIEGSGKAYVEGLITSIQETSSGREAAVNCALTMLKLAADQGVKLDYEHKGTMGIEPYVPTSEVASGVDCNPFASWVVDKGTENGFQWRPVGEFKYVGETLSDWTQAQPGDVFVNDGHVGIIIENDPETGTFTCAEASGTEVGIILQTRSYSSMQSKGYQVQDMTNVYNGTENTDRAIFNQYVNWDTYERKV